LDVERSAFAAEFRRRLNHAALVRNWSSLFLNHVELFERPQVLQHFVFFLGLRPISEKEVLAHGQCLSLYCSSTKPIPYPSQELIPVTPFSLGVRALLIDFASNWSRRTSTSASSKRDESYSRQRLAKNLIDAYDLYHEIETQLREESSLRFLFCRRSLHRKCCTRGG
jgi:hypothetical protein